MAGLREKKKKQSLARIIGAARGVLLEKGYAEATMDEIAARAEIGVGTLYNYYKSKADIFLSVMSQELKLDDEDMAELEIDLEMGAADIVNKYIGRSFHSIKLLGKGILRDIFAAMFSNTKPSNNMIKGVAKLDLKFIDKLSRLLEDLKDRGGLPADFNPGIAANTVYSIFITQCMMYVYMEDMTPEEFYQNIAGLVRFVFEGKCRGA